MKRITIMKILQVFVLAFGVFITANAQEKQSLTEFQGTVVDQAGGVIPLTRIVLTDRRGKRFEAVTNEEGVYQIRVPSGTYAVEAEYTQHRAWKRFKIEEYEIASMKKMTFDISLRVDDAFTEKHGTQLTSDPVREEKKPKSL